ncbi:MAG TPA: VacJ family lipoprotein [Methylomirabilota bacterium]|nr:VacJ family lipoprotein [Methylomirabilota bacterium]
MPRIVTGRLRRVSVALGCSFLIAVLTGCGSVSSSVKSEPSFLPPAQPVSVASDAAPGGNPELSATEERVDEAAATGDGADGGAGETVIAQAPTTPSDKSDVEGAPASEEEDSDPWERFNEKVFEFNRQTDRYVLKPVAKVYSVIIPEPFQVMIANGFDNISFVPRMVNSLLQGKWGGATRELSRFLINSTAGIGGLFDAAKYWGIEKSREDFGQTLGVWGVSPGPYLIVPFMEPMTVRDGIGRGVDSFMNPLSYFIPFVWVGISLKLGEIVNDRALNLDLFQGFEESVIDLYSAVRHGYLRRREQLIKE